MNKLSTIAASLLAAAMLAACGDGSTTYSDMVVSAGDTLAISGASKHSNWRTSNRHVATVTSELAIAARREGFVKVSNEDGDAFAVTVLPVQGSGYVVPYLDFGKASISDVKRAYSEANNDCHLKSEAPNGKYVVFSSTLKYVNQITAEFFGGKLDALKISVKNAQSPVFKQYINERYVKVKTEGHNDIYLTTDGQCTVSVPTGSNEVNVVYKKNDGGLQLPEE